MFFSGISQLVTGIALHVPSMLLLLTGVALLSFRYTTSYHRDGSTSSQIFHCCSLEWLCVISGILMLNWMASNHLRCFSAVSTSSQLSHCCSLGWLCVVPGVKLLFTLVAPHDLSCHTST